MFWNVLGVAIVVCLLCCFCRVIGFAMGFVVLMGVCVSLRKWLVDVGVGARSEAECDIMTAHDAR